jgi:hypothetical protein
VQAGDSSDLIRFPKNKRRRIMLASKFCHKFITNTLTKIHKKRKESLIRMVDSLIRGANLTVSSIGRHLSGKASVKHKINMSWRFLKNPLLKEALPLIYSQVGTQLMSGLRELPIAIDWSGCCGNKTFLLRASLLYQGRSLAIYNEVHCSKLQENKDVHRNFLHRLKEILPPNKKVIIVTDAGFKTPWFKEVAQLGWFFVGRVLGNICYKLDSEEQWYLAEHLHSQVKRGQTLFIGKGSLGKKSKTQFKLTFVAHFGRSKGRKNTKIRFPDAEKKQQNLARQPWILVTNLENSQSSIKPIKLALYTKQIYQKRMQIEQNFRDDKSTQFGAAWRFSRTQHIDKINILMLLAMLAALILWMIGFAAEQKKLHYSFQANTVRDKRVLSFPFLARQLIIQGFKGLNIRKFSKILSLFQIQFNEFSLLEQAEFQL